MSNAQVAAARQAVTAAHGGVIVALVAALAGFLLASDRYQLLALAGVAFCSLLLSVTRALSRVLVAVEEVSSIAGHEA